MPQIGELTEAQVLQRPAPHQRTVCRSVVALRGVLPSVSTRRLLQRLEGRHINVGVAHGLLAHDIRATRNGARRDRLDPRLRLGWLVVTGDSLVHRLDGLVHGPSLMSRDHLGHSCLEVGRTLTVMIGVLLWAPLEVILWELLRA